VNHVEDFKASLEADGNTGQYVRATISRVERVFEGCRFSAWTNISASRVKTFIAYLRKDRMDEKTGQVGQGISIQTANYYLQATKQFCRFMVQDRRALESPLEHLSKMDSNADARRKRRALEPDEIRRLLEVTLAAPERFGLSGHQRTMLYRLAIETGLRASELRSLTVSSFDFDECTVTVQAAYTKNRKDCTLPLRVEMAATLKTYVAGKLPHVNVFSVPQRTAEMLRSDLEATGIDYQDEAGRYVDFHSLRHMRGSLLAAAGVHPKVAQSLMRHSDIRLTMERYTHTLSGQESQAVADLPDLSLPSDQKQRAAATGTDGKEDVFATCLFNGCGQKEGLGEQSRTATGNGDTKKAVLTGPGRIRTFDQWIMSPLL